MRRLFTATCVLLGTAALLATAAAPVLTTHVFLSADGKVNTSLTTALSYLLLPAILFYGLSALLTAILNTRQVFKPGAWAPVLNNVVMLTVLVIYYATPGEITLDPVRMSDPKLLVLGVGVTLGVVVQAMSLVPAIRREGISLKPLWGLDDRLKQFGGMAVAIILYVLISQAGMIVATRISSHADASGPAIYNNAWLLLQLPYGVLGVTVLTAIMPRLSRNAAADDTPPAVVDDLSVATRLTMISLIPIITFLTFAGPEIGQALYGYGNFGTGDAERLGQAVSWSAFTLIPYSLVLIQLRVFYAREQAWTPTWIVLGITTVKIALSALTPDDRLQRRPGGDPARCGQRPRLHHRRARRGLAAAPQSRQPADGERRQDGVGGGARVDGGCARHARRRPPPRARPPHQSVRRSGLDGPGHDQRCPHARRHLRDPLVREDPRNRVHHRRRRPQGSRPARSRRRTGTGGRPAHRGRNRTDSRGPRHTARLRGDSRVVSNDPVDSRTLDTSGSDRRPVLVGVGHSRMKE